MATLLVRGIGRLFTATAAGVVEDAAVLVDGGRIAWAGPASRLPETSPDDELDAGGALVTPGLIDCHTHPVYAGNRFPEIAARSEGLSYAELGPDAGIMATVRATRARPSGELLEQLRARLARWPAGGATTVEAKTGYHLNREGELEAVALLRRLSGSAALPELHVTFLAAHACPPEFDGDLDAYADECASWSQDAAAAGADACDVFCDRGYFGVDASRRVLEAGTRAGLQARVHADELAHSGGAELAAAIRCASADHLLRVDPAGAAALASAGVVATLCPGTALSLGVTPDVAALRRAGVTIALGSDHNPGTSGLTDMSQVIALAVAALGMSVGEAVTAATAGGAASLRRDDRGRVAPGKRADLVVWDADHEGAFAWAWGLRPMAVYRAGTRLL